ncbi:MAG: 30S ribosomal protein S13 [Microgenomates bacterium 39_7]|nr:MAG: 30S ribosomal protein S13 [Microgenomates bacterium 39_7]
MPRVAGVDIPGDKKVPYALTYVYGIGLSTAKKLVKQVKIDPNKRASELDGQEINLLQKSLDKTLTEGDLRQQINDNINRLKRIKAYRGIRHMMGLPVRGQRTRVNARTRKGKRKTVGALSKEMATKLEAAKSETTK